MRKVFTIISIHSCPGEKIGLGNAGGLSIYVYNLINQLIHNNHQVNLISKKHDDCKLDFDEKKINLLHVDLKSEEYSFDEIDRKTDVLISNYWTSGIFAKKNFSNKKTLKINISHTLEYLKKEHIKNYVLNKKRVDKEISVFKYFDYILSFSSLESKILFEKYNVSSKKIISSSPGFEKDFFYPVSKEIAKERINFSNNEKLILFIGRYDYLKGLDIAIDAFEKLLENMNSVKLGIIGGDFGSVTQKKLEKCIISKNMSNKIIWFGSISQKNINNYYNSSDIVIIPSRSETFGLVCLEAMATKTPVIASKLGRMSDFVEQNKTGILINEIDSNEFSNSLLDFFQEKFNFHFDEISEKKINRFEWKNIIKEFLYRIKK